MTAKQEEPLVDPTGRESLDPKHAPVSYPAGSYDFDQLSKGLEKAAAAKPEKRDQMVNEALNASAAEDTVLDRSRASIPEGDVVLEVEHPELGITERTTAFSEKAQEKIDKAKEEAEAERTGDATAAPTTTGRRAAQSKGE